MIKKPTPVALAILVNSFRSGLVHFFTRWMESLANCFSGSIKTSLNPSFSILSVLLNSKEDSGNTRKEKKVAWETSCFLLKHPHFYSPNAKTQPALAPPQKTPTFVWHLKLNQTGRGRKHTKQEFWTIRARLRRNAEKHSNCQHVSFSNLGRAIFFWAPRNRFGWLVACVCR